MEREYTIQELFEIFFKKIWLIIILSILGIISAFSISKFLIAPQYSSSISMYIKNSNENSNTNYINSSDLTASQQLVNTYMVILQDDSVMKQLTISLNEKYSMEELGQYLGVSLNYDDDIKSSLNNSSLGISGDLEDYSDNYKNNLTNISKKLSSHLSMNALNNTEVLCVTATTTNAQLSADICNCISQIAPKVLIRVTGAGCVETIGVAEASMLPVSPNVSKNTLIGGAIGFIISILIIFIMDLFDTTLKSTSILTNNFNLINIGQIADVSNNKDKKKSINTKYNTILTKDIPFYFVEAFKLIRTNIMFSISTKSNNVIAISSANISEGKSIVSANISISLAQTGKKVLLIDCDLRKPVQHKIFDIKNKLGVSQYIGKMSNLDEIIQKNVINNLDIITSGAIPPNPSEMLASDNMKSFIKEISTLYDYVIIDTPPVNAVSDVLGLSNCIAGLILVARCQQTKYLDIAKAIDSFKVANIDILGFVLNGVENSYNKYNKYNKYGKYYKYYKCSSYDNSSGNDINKKNN